jgi:5'-AMP-activated protein kinase catalytic alpha subunit
MSEKEKEYKIGKYLIKRTLGRGTFGKVKLGIYLPTKEKVAIKILEKSKIREKDDEIRVQREFEMLTKFNHINLILVAEIFESYDAFYTVMEYCEGGELFNYIVKKRKLSEEESSFFYYQIIKGLEYIHSLNIVHRDLKPENLLLTRNHILKIIDFGLSNYFNNNQNNLLVTPCGSPCYASPEMVSGKKYNGFKIDIWSTGIILYAMLCGYLPFEDKDNDLLFKKILECKLDLPHHLSLLSKDLIKKILVTNPDKRITIKEIKKHPFFLKGKTLYKQEFSFSNIPFELIVDYDDSDNDFSYKNNKTETEGKNDYVLKSRDFNATVPNDNSQINKGNILFEEKKNNLEEDKIKENEMKKKEEKEKEKEQKK